MVMVSYITTQARTSFNLNVTVM